MDGGSPEITYERVAEPFMIMMLMFDSGFSRREYVGIAPKANCSLWMTTLRLMSPKRSSNNQSLPYLNISDALYILGRAHSHVKQR